MANILPKLSRGVCCNCGVVVSPCACPEPQSTCARLHGDGLATSVLLSLEVDLSPSEGFSVVLSRTPSPSSCTFSGGPAYTGGGDPGAGPTQQISGFLRLDAVGWNLDAIYSEWNSMTDTWDDIFQCNWLLYQTPAGFPQGGSFVQNSGQCGNPDKFSTPLVS